MHQIDLIATFSSSSSATEDLRRLPTVPGTYALLIDAPALTWVSAGRLGAFTLAAGRYAYVGSAHGGGGLAARVGRHLAAAKPLRWHIDHLTARLPVVGVVAAAAEARLECAWARRLLGLPGASAPVAGFGSSDCRAGCPAHLVRLPEGCGVEQVRAILSESAPMSSIL